MLKDLFNNIERCCEILLSRNIKDDLLVKTTKELRNIINIILSEEKYYEDKRLNNNPILLEILNNLELLSLFKFKSIKKEKIHRYLFLKYSREFIKEFKNYKYQKLSEYEIKVMDFHLECVKKFNDLFAKRYADSKKSFIDKFYRKYYHKGFGQVKKNIKAILKKEDLEYLIVILRGGFPWSELFIKAGFPKNKIKYVGLGRMSAKVNLRNDGLKLYYSDDLKEISGAKIMVLDNNIVTTTTSIRTHKILKEYKPKTIKLCVDEITITRFHAKDALTDIRKKLNKRYDKVYICGVSK